MRLMRVGQDGAAGTLHVARGAELLGEGGLVMAAYGCDAVAETACVVRAISGSEARRRLEASPELMWTLLARTLSGLHAARARLELRSIRGARERVLAHLALLAAPGSNVEFDRPMAEVARELGLTPEAYSRALRRAVVEGRLVRVGARAFRLM